MKVKEALKSSHLILILGFVEQDNSVNHLSWMTDFTNIILRTVLVENFHLSG